METAKKSIKVTYKDSIKADIQGTTAPDKIKQSNIGIESCA